VCFIRAAISAPGALLSCSSRIAVHCLLCYEQINDDDDDGDDDKQANR